MATKRGINPHDPDLEPTQHEQWFRDYYKDNTSRWKQKRGKQQAVIATLDFETDPFAGPGNPVAPFAGGFYDGGTYVQFWGEDCVNKIVAHIRAYPEPLIIYAHNGGKFDFLFMLDYIEPEVFTIGTRIVRAFIASKGSGDVRHLGQQTSTNNSSRILHQLRDSFSILPVPLSDAAVKNAFDYSNMHKSKREQFKDAILDYLKQDCIGLYDTVRLYRQEFGDALTMASAAMKKLQKAMVPPKGWGQPGRGRRTAVHQTLRPDQDEYLRPWYFGGRVQCFRRGVIQGYFKCYDINSSYPWVMKHFKHPISAGYKKGLKAITNDTDFAIIDAWSDGALPMRSENGSLDFPVGRFQFHATGHEIRAALELGLLKIFRVLDAMEAYEHTDFAPFIDTYYRKRLEAKAEHNVEFTLFWKLVMNGAYGKFAQNPRKFKDTRIIRSFDDAPDPAEGWELSERYDQMDIYTRPTFDGSDASERRVWRSFLNVGTGASITGAARAELLRGIVACKGLVYCDTDSLIATEFVGDLNSDRLGAFKTEVEGSEVAIVEKKTYAMWGARSGEAAEEAKRVKHWGDPYCVKLASKGVRATAAQIRQAASGEIIQYTQQAPSIKLDGSQTWLTRNIRMNSDRMFSSVPGREQSSRIAL